MVEIFRQQVTAAEVKAKARELGADLVGIADGGGCMNSHPPDPADIRAARSTLPNSTTSV